MVGQLYLTHAACTESLGKGIVSEDTIGGAWLGRIDAALGVSLRCGMGLFHIVAWTIRGRAGVGWGVGRGWEGHGARPRGRPARNGCCCGSHGGGGREGRDG